MEFCPECSSMMYPKGEDLMECKNCEAVTSITDSEVVTEEGGRDDLTILEDSEKESLPTTEESCPECENNRAYWYMQQTRSADESETRFYICTECDNKWRGYD